MPLFEIKVTEEEMFYVWNGERAVKDQRPMFPWYEHVGHIGELQCKKDSLAKIRLAAAQKFFSKKDSSHANIYRHYQDVSKW